MMTNMEEKMNKRKADRLVLFAFFLSTIMFILGYVFMYLEMIYGTLLTVIISVLFMGFIIRQKKYMVSVKEMVIMFGIPLVLTTVLYIIFIYWYFYYSMI